MKKFGSIALVATFLAALAAFPLAALAQDAADAGPAAVAADLGADRALLPVPSLEGPAQPAQPAPVPELQGVDDAAQTIVKAIGYGKAKDWRALGAAIIMLVVFGIRQGLGRYVAWFKTDRGGALMALLIGVLGTVASYLAAGGGWKWSILVDGVMAAFTAAGGFSVIKKLIAPSDAPAPAGK